MSQVTSDALSIAGNVTVQVLSQNTVIQEITKHNSVTNEGIVNLLRVLTLNRTSYITGIGIVYHDPDDSQSLDKEVIYNEFSSVRVVNGTQPYAEFRFYLPSDQLNGKTLIGANLKTKDSSGAVIDFATVRITDTLEDGTTPVIASEISKTSSLSVLYIWRIGISSEFVQIIY